MLRLSALVAGLLGGLTAWILDHLLANATLGYALPVEPRLGLPYLVVGLGLGLLTAWFGRNQPGRFSHVLLPWAASLALLYALPIFERLYQVLLSRLSPPLAASCAALALVGYGVWAYLLRRLSGSWPAAFLLTATTAAVGLAVNRNLTTRALDPDALLADGVILLVALALAGLYRKQGAWITVAAAILLLVLPFGLRFGTGPSTGLEEDRVARSSPDLILVIIDTLRLDVFQSVVRESPEGKEFARRLEHSAWFENLISTAPWTAPSVGSILTGLYPQEHGFGVSSDDRDPNRPLKQLASSVPTLAMRLQNRGYQTEAIGANPILHPVSGIHRGFDNYELLDGTTTKLPLLTALSRFGLVREEPYQPASAVRRLLKRRLPQLDPGSPLFFWLHLMDPHAPLHGHSQLPPEPGTEQLEGLERLYREEVRYALSELNIMIDELKRYGRFDDAVLLLLSDHGEMFPSDQHDTGAIDLKTQEPKLYGHGHALYGELVRVPLVIRPPGGLQQTREVKALVSQTDLHDTVVDLLSLDVPKVGRDRISLAPFLTDTLPEELPRRPFALIGSNQQGPRQRALRTEDLKLIEFLKPKRPSELFDILKDPKELHNLADQDERLPLVERLLNSKLALLEDAPENEDMEIDAETRRKLEALGYL